MGNKGYEGQMDFLGLLNEYKDEQGATVKVREPGKNPVRVSQGAKASIKIKDAEPIKKVKQPEPEQMKLSFVEFEPKKEKPPKKEETPKKEKPLKKEELPKKEEPSKKEEKQNNEKQCNIEQSSKEVLFKQCKRCWCFDCKHNSRNEAVPREMCGNNIPCPACDGCVAEDQATICEIGNAKEGCRFRAIEEGIFVPEQM